MYNWKLPDVKSSLNGCKVFSWKSDVLCFLKMKTWRVQYDFGTVFSQSQIWCAVKPLNQNLTRFENSHFKIMLYKKAPKMQLMSFSRSKINQNVVFWMQTFFQNLRCRKFFKSKSNASYLFQSKIWRFVKLCNHFLMRFEIFSSNSDTLGNLNSKSDKFRKFFSEIWFLSCFSGSDWMMIISVNVNNNLF